VKSENVRLKNENIIQLRRREAMGMGRMGDGKMGR
jgi:hypothetical protein